jgi:hypothetical protein
MRYDEEVFGSMIGFSRMMRPRATVFPLSSFLMLLRSTSTRLPGSAEIRIVAEL